MNNLQIFCTIYIALYAAGLALYLTMESVDNWFGRFLDATFGQRHDQLLLAACFLYLVATP